jgi:hypothetical protein
MWLYGEILMETSNIRVLLGDETGKSFVQFWNDERASGKISSEFGPATFRSSAPPRDAFGLAVPSEVIIAVVAGVTEGIAETAVKALWKKLKEFIDKRANLPSSRFIVLDLNGTELRFRASEMPTELPDKSLDSEDDHS